MPFCTTPGVCAYTNICISIYNCNFLRRDLYRKDKKYTGMYLHSFDLTTQQLNV